MRAKGEELPANDEEALRQKLPSSIFRRVHQLIHCKSAEVESCRILETTFIKRQKKLISL
jgi:hypothetical protein